MLMATVVKGYYKRVSAYIRVFDIPFKLIDTPIHVNMQTKLKCEWPHHDHVGLSKCPAVLQLMCTAS